MAGTSGAPTPARDKSVTPTPTSNDLSGSTATTANTSGGGSTSSTGPSPLTVGTRFVKEYYKTLSTNPDQIYRFYQPSSVLSVGVGSIPTVPSTFETLTSQEVKDRLFKSSDDSNVVDSTCLIRFEFEHGAIDAQQSVDNAILLVVTGHIVYLHPDDTDILIARKAFVHTFFLGSITYSGGKVSYYVHNDILRFLGAQIVTTAPITGTTTPAVIERTPEAETSVVPTVTEAPPVEVAPLSNGSVNIEKPVIDEVTEPAVPEKINSTSKDDDAPGRGVEESKEVMSEEAEIDEEDTLEEDNKIEPPVPEFSPVDKVETEVVVDDDNNKEPVKQQRKEHDKKPGGKSFDKKTGAESKQSAGPKPSKQVPAKPGSWASLVAGGAGTGPSPPSNVPTQTKSVPSTTIPSASPAKSKSAAAPTKTNDPEPGASTAPNETVEATTKEASNATQENATESNHKETNHRSSSQQQKVIGNDTYRRDPDSTLVIRNIPFEAVEKDILGIFEKFATDVNGRVIRCTVNADKGIAFMDYDSPDPVLNAIAVHKEAPFYLMDRKLHIYQKVLANQAAHGGNNNQNSHKNNSSNNRSGGGGRSATTKNGGRSGEAGNENDQGQGRTSRGRGGESSGGARGSYRRSGNTSGGDGARGTGGGGGGGGGGRGTRGGR